MKKYTICIPQRYARPVTRSHVCHSNSRYHQHLVAKFCRPLCVSMMLSALHSPGVSQVHGPDCWRLYRGEGAYKLLEFGVADSQDTRPSAPFCGMLGEYLRPLGQQQLQSGAPFCLRRILTRRNKARAVCISHVCALVPYSVVESRGGWIVHQTMLGPVHGFQQNVQDVQ